MNIALIDGGLSCEGKLKNKIIAKKEFIIETENMCDGRFSLIHGTTCAEIILDVCPDVRFWDLKVIYQDGTTKTSVLLEALEWCFYNKIKLINLSLGSVNYFDIKSLQLSINRLLEQNTIIVAAYHNRNIRTYPASFPGVFGVRQDRHKMLKTHEFLFQEQLGFVRENTIVAHWQGKDGDNFANSYAAPIITGLIATFLSERPGACIDEVIDFLEKHAVQDKVYPDKVDNVIKRSQNIGIPVIAGIGLRQGEMLSLTAIFLEKEYNALLLGENPTDGKTIPMEYYRGKDISLANIIYTVNSVYKPDIMLLDFISSEICGAVQSPYIDMFIFCIDGVYKVYAEELIGTAKDLNGVSDIVCRYFQ